jgi:hypothetical protein
VGFERTPDTWMSVDEPPARRCKREDDGVEGTYGYELECYLKDLPATLCSADQLPARVENRAQSFVVNADSCDREGTHWVAFHFPKEGSAEFFDSFGRAPETYHRHFRNVLIANEQQYKLNTVRVQPEDATPVDSIAFISSNTDIETLLWKIS